MKRREFLALVGAAAGLPLAAAAQELGRVYRIGTLLRGPRDAPYVVAFFDELQRSGFVEGQNLAIDAHGFGLHEEQFADHATELVKAQVDAIVAAGDAGIHAAQQATKTIPILGAAVDMVGAGYVHSLAHPGGNTTGLTILANQLDGKRQEILMEVMPGARRMAALADSNEAASPPHLQMLQEVAHTRRVELLVYRASRLEEIVGALETAKNAGAEALNVLASVQFYGYRKIILERVAALRMPAIYATPEESEAGGLVAYGPRVAQLYRDILGRQCVKLLRGAKPTDLPVEQPTKFEMVVNLKTAKALGLTIPESFLQRADKVIE